MKKNSEATINSKPTEDLLFLFNEGKYFHAYHIFGAHEVEDGIRFTVWAPNVKSVCVIGEWNDWQSRDGKCLNGTPENKEKPIDEGGDYLYPIGSSGVWSGIIKDAELGMCYKYMIETEKRKLLYKADPYAFMSEVRPGTASRVWDLKYDWKDGRWMDKRLSGDRFKEPLNIYEVHLGSWKRHPSTPENEDGFYSYRDLADSLIPYVKEMGYTHMEILPVMEHPLDASWGYQTTGYFAATSRYGAPQDLMYFIDRAHQAGIGVILDWTPGHFCRDEQGLADFNGEHLYELREHPQWGTYEFDYGRGEVKSFLISNAIFWLEQFHADGIRVDGVSSMLYMNFGIDNKKDKRFNPDGTEGDLDAIAFLKELNTTVATYYPDVLMIAEESTAWPLVTYPPDDGGLGFHFKWDMGWMHDTLHYMQTDFPYRTKNHNFLTFSMMYNYAENYILPFSHDEVVHGKCSLIGRMPGDYWRQFAGLRVLNFYQMTHPGAKLNFMGNELAEFIEWREWEELEWFMLDFDSHRKHQQYVKAMNKVYLSEKALWEADFLAEGFQWLDADNAKQNIYSYLRKTQNGKSVLAVVLNMSVPTYEKFRVGVPKPGIYEELINSDAEEFGGSGKINKNQIKTEKIPYHGQEYSIEITVPPLGGTILKYVKALPTKGTTKKTEQKTKKTAAKKPKNK